MSATPDDWRDLCQADDLRIMSGRRARVRFDTGRSHDVTILPTGDAYLVTARITAPGHIPDDWAEHKEAWLRNRRSQLVGFRVTADDALEAHGWTPRAGLTAAALRLLIRTVAREADRYEYEITGADQH